MFQFPAVVYKHSYNVLGQWLAHYGGHQFVNKILLEQSHTILSTAAITAEL